MPLQHSREDYIEERVTNLFSLTYAAAAPLDPHQSLALHAAAETGKDVQMDRHYEILGRSPERFIMVRRKRQILMRNLPNHRAAEPFLLAALELFDRMVSIVNGNQGDADKTLRRTPAVINEPVVIHAKTPLLKRGILDTEQP